MKTFWKKKLPACLLALALLAGTVPMASAASADLTYDVDEDSGVWLDADDFQEIYEDDNGGYLEYVEFTDYDDFDDEYRKGSGLKKFFIGALIVILVVAVTALLICLLMFLFVFFLNMLSFH